MEDSFRHLGKPEKKRHRFFQFDPAVFRPLPKARIHIRMLAPLRGLGRHAFYTGLIMYPLIMVIVGVLFGGIVFWISIVGSMGLLGLLIRKMGFSRNFENWDVSPRRFLVILAAFGITAGFFWGMTTLKLWFIPVFVGALSVGIIIVLIKGRV